MENISAWSGKHLPAVPEDFYLDDGGDDGGDGGGDGGDGGGAGIDGGGVVQLQAVTVPGLPCWPVTGM